MGTFPDAVKAADTMYPANRLCAAGFIKTFSTQDLAPVVSEVGFVIKANLLVLKVGDKTSASLRHELDSFGHEGDAPWGNCVVASVDTCVLRGATKMSLCLVNLTLTKGQANQ